MARQDVFLGLGQVYFNNVRLGIPETSMMVHYAQTLAGARAGDMKGDQLSQVVSDEMTLDLEISDLTLAQMQQAFGRETGNVATISTALWFWEEVLNLTAVTAKTLTKDKLVTNSVVLTTLDYATAYVEGAAFTVSESAGTITRITSGGITSGKDLMIHYRFNETNATVLKVGGTDSIEHRIDFVLKDSSGKILQYIFPKCVRMDNTDIVFSKDTAAKYRLIFKVHADPTLAKGEQFCQIAREP